MILLTGASGMLGSYIKDNFKGEKIASLGRSEENDIRCDLTKEIPEHGKNKYDTIIHCAGTEDDAEAWTLNFDGTQRLINSLEGNKPENFVYISSYKVYSDEAGENVTEEENTWATNESGKSKQRTEQLLRDWAEKNDVTLTIIRPARMFGNGVKGETLQLFNDAVSGKYIHVRGNDARLSVVTALDVAKGVRGVYKYGGIYNAADGHNPGLIELTEAMTANSGGKKRMTHLPPAWAEWLWRLGRWIPSINRNLHPEVVEKRMKTLTIDGTKLAEKTGFDYFNTIEVIERIAKDYPYVC